MAHLADNPLVLIYSVCQLQAYSEMIYSCSIGMERSSHLKNFSELPNISQSLLAIKTHSEIILLKKNGNDLRKIKPL